ncbi:MAG TPA: glycosyltransferase family 2 protein [Pyrinomonadaceae bacterium]|nr:glycosyltransferase family 2 protein [Pyrinomonadaceae bacterium]
MMGKQSIENESTFTVVVPVYNSTDDLRHCLAALAGSEFRDFEVVVVDDGSTEDVKSLVDGHGFSYLRIAGPGGPARARNRGVALARGRYVVFVDADVCVHRDALSHFAEAFAADPTIDAVIGSYDDAPAKQNFLSQYKNLFHHYVHQQSSGEVITFWSGCGAIRRELFLACGGFDEERYRRPAIEDIELGTWLSAAGHKIILNPQIKGQHLKRWTVWNLVKTDIFDRGIPWTRLMLRAGSMANTLNVKPIQRISVILTCVTLLTLLVSVWWPKALLGVVPLFLAVTLLNLDFYRFFFKRAGFWFTLRVVPLHWLYFSYCALSFVWGALLHYVVRDNALPRQILERTRPDAVGR